MFLHIFLIYFSHERVELMDVGVYVKAEMNCFRYWLSPGDKWDSLNFHFAPGSNSARSARRRMLQLRLPPHAPLRRMITRSCKVHRMRNIIKSMMHKQLNRFIYVIIIFHENSSLLLIVRAEATRSKPNPISEQFQISTSWFIVMNFHSKLLWKTSPSRDIAEWKASPTPKWISRLVNEKFFSPPANAFTFIIISAWDWESRFTVGWRKYFSSPMQVG